MFYSVEGTKRHFGGIAGAATECQYLGSGVIADFTFRVANFHIFDAVARQLFTVVTAIRRAAVTRAACGALATYTAVLTWTLLTVQHLCTYKRVLIKSVSTGK